MQCGQKLPPGRTGTSQSALGVPTLDGLGGVVPATACPSSPTTAPEHRVELGKFANFSGTQGKCNAGLVDLLHCCLNFCNVPQTGKKVVDRAAVAAMQRLERNLGWHLPLVRLAAGSRSNARPLEAWPRLLGYGPYTSLVFPVRHEPRQDVFG